MKKYDTFFLNFVEEWWQGQKENWRLGRMEIEVPEKQYAIQEIRWHVEQQNWDEWDKFRDKYDFEDVSRNGLAKVIREIRNKFQNRAT